MQTNIFSQKKNRILPAALQQQQQISKFKPIYEFNSYVTFDFRCSSQQFNKITVENRTTILWNGIQMDFNNIYTQFIVKKFKKNRILYK